jgi:circadian clock protein KaiC
VSAASRIGTGIPGLDTILEGGFLKGGLYIAQGSPGAGKTILANQVAFHRVGLGEQVVYVTLLAETHARLMVHLQSLSFFDRNLVSNGISYVSGFSILEQEGLPGLLEMLRREARARKASLLVLDGLVAAEESADNERAYKKFIHELQIHCNLVNCMVLMLTSQGLRSGSRPEHTMVDGILELNDKVFSRRAERELVVRKFRGSGFLRGEHTFRIASDGISVFPRIEAVLAQPDREDVCRNDRVSTGVDTLDRMVEGGWPCGSTTLVSGASGTGKTTLGLHFLSKCTPAEPGLLFGFYETPERLLMKARRVGLNLDGLVKEGALEILWFPPTDRILDELGGQLLEAVRRRKVRRLVVDGLNGFSESAVYPDRVSHYFTALTNEFRVRSVTTVYVSETPNIIGPEVTTAPAGISNIAENMVLLRFVELNTKLSRLLSVLKVRDSDYDSTLREFVISDKGIVLANNFESADKLMTGTGEQRESRRPPGSKKSGPRRRRKT